MAIDMGPHMKTTLDISDALFSQARQVAQSRGETFRSVVEAALRQYLESNGPPTKRRFRLRRHAFEGRGLRPEVAGADWDRIRELAYGGRGGE